MRVAFRVDSGAGIGMGHLTRMSALADAFSEYRAESIFFQSSDEPVDYAGFDIVILDSYLLSDEYIDALNEEGRLLVCYDDNALYTYSCDVLVNANLYASKMQFQYGRKKPILLLGGEYALLRREYWNAKPITIREDANHVLLTFGGADVNDFTDTALEAITAIPGIHITAVFGPASSGYEKCINRFEALPNIALIKDPPSMCSLMQGCDIAISSASSTVYELAALGIPSLVIPQADNQRLISEYLNEHGLIRSLGWWSDVSAESLCEETKALLYNVERRRSESEMLQASVDSEGARHLAKEIIAYKNEIA